MSSRVLIIGCGVAGPVIALLLQRKGYTPIVLEKVPELSDVGSSLMLMPNGLKVLSLLGIAGAATDLAPPVETLEDRKFDGTHLGETHFPSQFKKLYNQPACGVRRTYLNLGLRDALVKAGIDVLTGWKLKNMVVGENSVTVTSEDGRTEEGSFLVGCDGIKSVARTLLFRERGLVDVEADFTGLTQICGLSPTPQSLKENHIARNFYGPGAHLICYQVTSTHTSWALTRRSPIEEVETWRFVDPEVLATLRADLLSRFGDWTFPVPDLISTTERLIKYGIYDRPHIEPEQWYNSRCILIGDAAHPTSPHLGQGANQALEDCYHLARSLPDSGNDANLIAIFRELSLLRQPKTKELVQNSRMQGELRVVDGEAATLKRDAILRQIYGNKEALEKRYDMLLREPF